MVFNGHFIVSVLVGNQVQRDLANGTVPLAYETEYGIRLRNRNSRNAVADIFIDGEKVSGPGYIVYANNYTDIYRFHDVLKKFKFVDLESPDATDFGKSGPNYDKIKGLIEVHFHFEREYYPYATTSILRGLGGTIPYNPQCTWKTTNNQKAIFPCSDDGSGNYMSQSSRGKVQLEGGISGFYSAGGGGGTIGAGGSGSIGACGGIGGGAVALGDGCTVEGSYNNQEFRQRAMETEAEFITVKVFLQGFDPHAGPLKGHKTNKRKPSDTNSQSDNSQQDLLAAEHENAILKLELENAKLRAELAKLQND